MSRNLEQIANWIGLENYANKNVIEVGAGSGHLARLMAHHAQSIVVFEPSTGLKPEMLPESNLVLVNRPFKASLVNDLADLIVCRQVLEHVIDPEALLREMRMALSTRGCLYLEVPRAEYIWEHAAILDLHCAHVQYFFESNLKTLIARTGFEIERMWVLKNGHDFGLMLRPVNSISQKSSLLTQQNEFQDIAVRLKRRRKETCDRLTNLPGKVALYGATWHGVAFLHLFQQCRKFIFFMDDNTAYRDFSIYSQTQTVPVCLPLKEKLQEVDVVLIIAYLHDQVIAEKLRDMKFYGKVLSIRNENTFVNGI